MEMIVGVGLLVAVFLGLVIYAIKRGSKTPVMEDPTPGIYPEVIPPRSVVIGVSRLGPSPIDRASLTYHTNDNCVMITDDCNVTEAIQGLTLAGMYLMEGTDYTPESIMVSQEPDQVNDTPSQPDPSTSWGEPIPSDPSTSWGESSSSSSWSDTSSSDSGSSFDSGSW